jgi:exopolyphosphatase / guanosine-5'-triphosphate,3'-diphosphate pyrophosphatase
MPSERLAVMDLGSNSFRLVVFSAADGWWQRTDEIYQAVRIGEGMAATRRLGEAPIARALTALEVFSHFCGAAGLTADAVATSAIRDAENSSAFLKEAKRRTGLPIRVLSKEEEARYGYLAAVNSTTLEEGCVLDLGGGSMQLVEVRKRLAGETGSWRVGAVRMTERFLPGPGPAKRRQIDELRGYVAGELKGAPWLRRTGRRIVGIGGTVRSLAAVAQRAEGLPDGGVQGATVSREALGEIVARLAALPPAERATVPGVKATRADLILAGAVVVEAVLEAGGFDELEVTEAGLREGVFFERHLSDPARPGREPLFEDVRRASVENLAARYDVRGEHTRHVAALALGMFDQLAAMGLHRGDGRERELLWAACMLHDIGMSVGYDDHHKHSRYLILNAGLPGFTPTEAAIVAQAARYHRKGLPLPGPLGPLFGEGDAARLDRCAVLLRLAEDLERSRDQLVRDTELSAQNGEVRLRLLAEGGAAVPRWAAGRECALFARAFDRSLKVVA